MWERKNRIGKVDGFETDRAEKQQASPGMKQTPIILEENMWSPKISQAEQVSLLADADLTAPSYEVTEAYSPMLNIKEANNRSKEQI